MVNFTAPFENSEFHNYIYFENRMDKRGNDFGNGMYHVVSDHNKAIDDDGMYKNMDLYPLAKHDFSTLIA